MYCIFASKKVRRSCNAWWVLLVSKLLHFLWSSHLSTSNKSSWFFRKLRSCWYFRVCRSHFLSSSCFCSDSNSIFLFSPFLDTQDITLSKESIHYLLHSEHDHFTSTANIYLSASHNPCNCQTLPFFQYNYFQLLNSTLVCREYIGWRNWFMSKQDSVESLWRVHISKNFPDNVREGIFYSFQRQYTPNRKERFVLDFLCS